MLYRMVLGLFVATISFNLASCAFFHTTQEEDRQARCKLLNRQIIFNAATANPGLASQQRAQLDTLSKNYREDQCDYR